MNICLLSEKYTPDIGGLAISAGRFANLLTSIGHEVRVFAPTLSLRPSEQQTLPLSGVHVTRFGAHKRTDDTLVDWFEFIVEEHKRNPFDLLHAYFLTQAGFVAVYAGKYLNIPSVVSIRGNDIERAAFDPSKFSHVMYTLQNAGAVTTNAKELAMKAKAFINREIHLIPNGVETERFKFMPRNEELAAALGLAGKKNEKRTAIVGFVGELREKKGLKTLLSACTQVNNQCPGSLLIVGEVRQGEDKQTLDEFRLSNPDTHVVVTGQIPYNDLPSYYSLIDVFVHPSLREGMPNAILEAMACEKAVIATPVGGVKDILEDGKNGIIVNVNNADMLAGKILELLDNPEKRAALGKNARELVVNKFTPKMELEANLSVYQTLGLKVQHGKSL